MSKVWTQKNGTEITVDQMTDSHIINCLRLSLRRMDHWKAELDRQYEDFMDDFGEDYDMATAIQPGRAAREKLDLVMTWVNTFCEELARRGYEIDTEKRIVRKGLSQKTYEKT